MYVREDKTPNFYLHDQDPETDGINFLKGSTLCTDVLCEYMHCVLRKPKEHEIGHLGSIIVQNNCIKYCTNVYIGFYNLQ